MPDAQKLVHVIYIYYRFIVRFPIVLDFLFITSTFLLHLLLSWTSSLSISSSAISASTLSNHVFLGHPTDLLPSTLYSIHFFTQSSSPFLITCTYHLSLPLLMKVVIGSTPTSLLNSSFVLLSFNEIPHMWYSNARTAEIVVLLIARNAVFIKGNITFSQSGCRGKFPFLKLVWYIRKLMD